MSTPPLLAAALLVCVAFAVRADPARPWVMRGSAGSLAQRIATPSGFTRVAAPDGSFAAWLRDLPLREPGTPARLFDGREKTPQDGVFAVVDIDVDATDLQQCADAVMRLRAEYLWAAGCAERIAFDFTSGDAARWSEWQKGQRPVVSGNKVSWETRGRPDASYASFRRYLRSVFTYAGSASLARELEAVADPAHVRPGDVFIQGGFPGHAVLVVDVAQNAQGERRFLIAQSYMPAQDIHVLRNPEDRDSAWYPARAQGTLHTPEWTFDYRNLRRFPATDCATTPR